MRISAGVTSGPQAEELSYLSFLIGAYRALP